MVAAGERVIASAPADGSEERLRQLGAEFVPIPLKASSRSIFGELRLFASLLKIVREIRPRAVLTFTIKPNIYGSIAARLLGVPAFATISGLGSAFIGGGATRALVTKMFAFALSKTCNVFFQNAEDRDLFVSEGMVDPGKAILVPGSGIDLKQFVPTALAPLTPFTFLMIGRLLRDKGIVEYAASAQLFQDRGIVARFVILGEIGVDNPSAVPKEQVARWVADGLLEHLEPVADVRPMIAAAHAIVLPSYREGLPRSLLEGAAMARPLVATDVPGCREVVRDGENGFLCAPRSASALADALQRLMSLDHADRERMGLAGRRLVEQVYDDRLVSAAYAKALAA